MRKGIGEGVLFSSRDSTASPAAGLVFDCIRIFLTVSISIYLCILLYVYLYTCIACIGFGEVGL